MGQFRVRYGTLALVPALLLTQGPQRLPRCAQAMELDRLGQYEQGHLASKAAPDYSGPGQGLAQVQSGPRNWDGLEELQMLAHVPNLGWHFSPWPSWSAGWQEGLAQIGLAGAEGNAQVPRLQ